MVRANKKPGAGSWPGFQRASRECLFVRESRYIVNNSQVAFLSKGVPDLAKLDFIPLATDLTTRAIHEFRPLLSDEADRADD
jgi:hypothetical protein